MHLIPSATVTMNRRGCFRVLALRRLPIDVSSPANSGTIDDLGLGVLIRKLKAFSVVVRSALVPVDFALIWWSVVGHRDVALSMDVRSDG